MMIAKPLPSFDILAMAAPSAAVPSGDASGATSFDKLIAQLSAPAQGNAPAADFQPGRIRMPFQAKAAEASFAAQGTVPGKVAALLQGGAPEMADPEASTSDTSPGDVSAPASSAPAQIAVLVQPGAAVIISAGVTNALPGQTPAAPMQPNAPETTEALEMSAALMASAPVRTEARPTRAAKAFEPKIAIIGAAIETSAKPLEIKADVPVVLDIADATEAVQPATVKVEPAIIVLHQKAPEAPVLVTALVNVASTGTELASQSLETKLDVVKDAQWIDRAARDIAQLATGEGRLRFRLDPDHLGSLQIDMANGPDGLSMRLTTDTEAARAILADAQPRLIAEARAQGVRIAEAHIDMGSHTSGEGRNAQPQPQRTATLIAGDQAFESEAAETAVSQSSERFA